MDKYVRELVDVVQNMYRYDSMAKHQEAIAEAIARVEARLIPEGHVAVPVEHIEWYYDACLIAAETAEEQGYSNSVDGYEKARKFLDSLTDRERQDAAPYVPGEHIGALELTFEHVDEGTTLLAAPPAPETCPECGAIATRTMTEMIVHKPYCPEMWPRISYSEDGTGSTDAEGG